MMPISFYPTWRKQAKAELAPPTTSLRTRTVLLTAATGVIGTDAARILAELQPERLVFGVRNAPKAEALTKELHEQHGTACPETRVLELDATSFDSVKRFAASVKELGRLDAVILGAGIFPEKREVGTDGWEKTLQTHHLSNALLTVLLLPQLAETAKTYSTEATLSHLSTSAILAAKSLLQLPSKDGETVLRQVDQMKGLAPNQYARTKTVQLYFVRRLAESFKAPGVTLVALDPGSTHSPVTGHWVATLMLMYFGRSANMCARAVVNSILPHEGHHGTYLRDYDVAPVPSFMDEEPAKTIEQRIWDETKDVLSDISPEAKQFYQDLADGKYGDGVEEPTKV